MTFLGFIPPLSPGSYDGDWHDVRVDLDRSPMSRQADLFSIQMLARWGVVSIADDLETAFSTNFWRFYIP